MAVDLVRAPGLTREGIPDISWRFLSVPVLICAVILYGVAGSPTPDTPGITEIVIGGLLGLAVFCSGGVCKVAGPAKEGWVRAGRILMFYGFSIPVLGGVMAGNDLSLMIRDLIPFLFLLLPLMIDLPGDVSTARRVSAALVFLGLAFSVRVLTYSPTAPEDVVDPYYLANAPTVLFAALLLIGVAGKQLYMRFSAGSLMQAAVLLAMAVVPLLAMALVVQRASFGLMGLAVLFWLLIGAVKAPRRVFGPFLICTVLLILGWGPVSVFIEALWHKTTLVGMNMRWQEAQAVLALLSESPLTVLFGKGWGATFASPAVADITVNYTHSLLTTYFLKTGLTGLVMVIVYLGYLGWELWRMLFIFPVVAVALAAPFFIDTLLYASFKSFDFGLLLLLIVLWRAVSSGLNKTVDSST
ncbi:MAG: hypothetical protein H6868_00210 [Rhodospirillales bacterium]|nr:hypothetical protein [Rhodospirillales bacterium]